MIEKLIKKLQTNKNLIQKKESDEKLSKYIDELQELKKNVEEALNKYERCTFSVVGTDKKDFARIFFENYKEWGSWTYQPNYIFEIKEKGLKKLDKELKKYNLNWRK